MDAEQFGAFLAVLATAGVLALVAVGLVAVVRRPLLHAGRQAFAGWAVPSAAAVAVAATAASLWLSERLHLPPCELCWYQRIAMYPLAAVLVVGAIVRDRGVRRYALVLAAGGLAVNLWHNYVETFPDRGSGSCDPANPCTLRWIEAFGWWTIPRMVTVCFVLVIALLLLDAPAPAEQPTPSFDLQERP